MHQDLRHFVQKPRFYSSLPLHKNHGNKNQNSLASLLRLMSPTLALMMVGLGSKIPCIFLKAGMTKRLQVTTADTGFPGTNRRTGGGGGEEKAQRKISE